MTGAAAIAPRIKLPYPHPGQVAVRQNARRFNWLAAGRRWRKTTLVMAISVEAAARGQQIVWGAPTYDQVRVGWEETRRAAAGVADFNQSRMTATFPRGGAIIYRSLDDPDNARGYTADGVVVDEAGVVKDVAWYEVLRPMLLDTGGWAWIFGTPKGRTWFWQEHANATGRADSIAWQAPTLGVTITAEGLKRTPHPLENPHIPFGELEQMYHTLPERIFRQEILAEFIEDTGGVFRGVSAAATATAQSAPIDGHKYSMGVDWGKHNDFTVLTVLDMTSRSVAAVDRFNQIDYTVQRSRLTTLANRFKCKPIIAEKNSIGEPIIEVLQREGLPVEAFTTTNASKAEAIEALALAFEKEDIKILSDPVTIAELQSYEAERLPSGMLRYGAPDGMHDDTVMSLALAWQSVAHPPAKLKVIKRNPIFWG